MFYILNYLKNAFSLELELVLLSFNHPNYRGEIIKGNMPLYEVFKGKEIIDSEPWEDYVSGRSIIQMAWMAYKFYRGNND